MNLLTSAEARQIAESVWGRGGTSTKRTNTRGAFYFSCSGHGGFVIDARVLSDGQKAALEPFVTFDPVTRYHNGNGKTYGIISKYRRNSFKAPFDCLKEEFQILLLEEDCEWALVYVFTDIRFRDSMSGDEELARETFWNWMDPTNPQVMARKHEEHCRKMCDPNLIVAAMQTNVQGVTEVITADQKTHRITKYVRDRFGTPWLSLCELVEG